jgi:hypothetical protein
MHSRIINPRRTLNLIAVLMAAFLVAISLGFAVDTNCQVNTSTSYAATCFNYACSSECTRQTSVIEDEQGNVLSTTVTCQ